MFRDKTVTDKSIGGDREVFRDKMVTDNLQEEIEKCSETNGY